MKNLKCLCTLFVLGVMLSSTIALAQGNSEHTLTINFDDSMVTVVGASSGATFNHGDEIDLEIKPKECYEVSSVSSATRYENYDYYYLVKMDGDKTVTIVAKEADDDSVCSNGTCYSGVCEQEYFLTYDVNDSSMGTITGDVDNLSYAYNMKITLTAVANSCHMFVNWTDENGDEVSTSATYVFNITKETSLTANFEVAVGETCISANNVDGMCRVDATCNDSRSLTYAVSDNSMGGITGDTEGDYNYNELITLTAVANSCHMFVNWTDENGDEVSTSPTYKFEMTENTSLIANFEPLTQYMFCDANETAGTCHLGICKPHGVLTVKFDDKVCDVFVKGSESATEVQAENGKEYKFFYDEVVTITPTLKGKECTELESVYYDGRSFCEPSTCLNREELSNNGSGVYEVTIGDNNKTIVVNVINADDGNSCNGGTCSNGKCKAKRDLTVRVNDPSMGTTTFTGTKPYKYKTTKTIRATPAGECHEFVHWTDENGIVIGTESKINVLMDEDKTIVAHFQVAVDGTCDVNGEEGICQGDGSCKKLLEEPQEQLQSVLAVFEGENGVSLKEIAENYSVDEALEVFKAVMSIENVHETISVDDAVEALGEIMTPKNGHKIVNFVEKNSDNAELKRDVYLAYLRKRTKWDGR